MPILPPSLDDRRFDDLVNELVARIPAHTPEWTNPRLGDPGRTLIELFAWLTDTLLYRANLVPERQRLVFLKLLGERLRPAQPATGIVALSFAQPTQLAACTLAPGARVKAAVPFETLRETTVLPVTAEVYYKRALSDGEATRMAEVLNGLASVHRAAVGRGAVKGYEATSVFDAGRAEPGGIDLIARSADRALWLALLAPQAPQPAQQADWNAAARKALGGGDGGAPAELGLGVKASTGVSAANTNSSANASRIRRTSPLSPAAGAVGLAGMAPCAQAAGIGRSIGARTDLIPSGLHFRPSVQVLCPCAAPGTRRPPRRLQRCTTVSPSPRRSTIPR
ncbi:MAG: hypothetical protein NVS9B10_15510 [Nevskia sp.]